MAVRTWTGAVSNLWNVAGNWDTLPSAGDDLVFPPTPTGNKSNSNNFAADTAFNSITIQGTGYMLAGNRITLGAGGITQTTGTNTISLAIVLGADVTVAVAGTTLTLSGIISDGAGSAVAKTGTAQLTLDGANTFTGGLWIKAGTVNGITSTSCLGGSGTGAVTLGDSSGTADATLQIGMGTVTMNNPLTVAAGSSGTLKLQNSLAGTTTYAGAIVLANNLTISGTAGAINFRVSGGVTGTGNLIVSHSNTGGVIFQTTTLDHVGTIVNNGSSTGTTEITVVIGTNVTAVTQASATSKLILSGAGTIANCSNKLAITSGQLQLSTANTVANLFVDATGCTDKTAQLILAATQTVTTELKLRGSVANRLLVTSDILTTARRITVFGATVSNCQTVDFRDIDFNNGGLNVDLSAITGGSGDCGGNTITGGGTLSFTTADDWYWYSAGAGTYNLSDRTYWFTATAGGGTQMGADRGPLPQDMLYVDGSSINGATTIDQDMPRMPGIDFTGCDAVAFHIDNEPSQACYGSLISSANVSLTQGTVVFAFVGRGSFVFNPSSQTWGDVYVASFGGSITLTGNLTVNTALRTFRLLSGTFDADIYNVSAFTINNSTTGSRTLLMGSGTWACDVWTFTTTTGLTSVNIGEESTLRIGRATSNTDRTFAGGGLTYNNLSVVANTTGTQQITISGSNTFNEVTVNGPKTINFTAGTTQTISAFATTGTGIVLKSTSAGSPWYLVDPSGTNQASNCTISDSYPRGSDAGGGALWLASDGTNTDAGGNVAYDGATNRGWKWTGFAPWLMRRRRRMAGAR